MAPISDRLQAVRGVLAQLAQSPRAEQVRAALMEDLPAFLLELGTVSPMQMRDIAHGLDGELAHLIRVCVEERSLLGPRAARTPLTIDLSLARIAGVVAPLESALSYYANALHRSDPRLTAISPLHAVPVATATPSALTARPHIQPRDCRRVAEQLRSLLHDVATAAERARTAISGHGTDDPFAIAGAIAQAQVLMSWLRLAEARFSAEAPAHTAAGQG
jgi:hypothetical protein